jgi:hypothetical protein
MQTKEEILQACTVSGKIVKLPSGKLDRQLYVKVANAIKGIGGRWKGGKTSGFIFERDPTDLLKEIASGTSRNLKKELQFFETPPDLARKLVDLASIDRPDLLVLEPSAGRGAIVRALVEKEHRLTIHCYELDDVNRAHLAIFPEVQIHGNDFLQARPILYDRIVANPPFSRNQDIQHIIKMYYWLKAGGRMITITSRHWQTVNGKKEESFRKWLKQKNYELHHLDPGEFKASGTNAATSILVIQK